MPIDYKEYPKNWKSFPFEKLRAAGNRMEPNDEFFALVKKYPALQQSLPFSIHPFESGIADYQFRKLNSALADEATRANLFGVFLYLRWLKFQGYPHADEATRVPAFNV